MHENQRTDHTATYRRLSATALASGPDYLAAAREALVGLLADRHLLDGLLLERAPGAYTRNLLYGDERISVFVMVWSGGARTSIHDHHCSCCYALLSGALQEAWYEPIGDRRVTLSRQFVRNAGQIACLLPTGPNLHSMTNASEDEAVSIHIYGYDSRARASSIASEYEVAARLPEYQD